jgi:caffeoyl-CoA O-methyltransferase
MALILVPEEIDAYAASHTTAVPPLLAELGAATQERFGARSGMLSGQVPGTLLQMLIFASGAKRVLEIGMFTGFSAQMMAAALPDDGRVTTCDVDPQAIAMAKEFFARSPVGHKIDVREGPALETMKSLEPGFGLIFIDADKGNYINYYEAALPLLAPRGLIVVDNVLWSGRVLKPERPDDHAIVAFNEHVRDDPRVAQVMLTVRDGMTIIRRV